ncbi:MAG: LysR family transcriptional regulator [Chloroflexota bacterium]
MEFKQLEMFVAVAEERSIMRAAVRVFRTQPAVSMALAKLEEEVGSRLFHRSRELRFHLTSAGEVLHEYAKRLLALRDEAARLVTRRAVPTCSPLPETSAS